MKKLSLILVLFTITVQSFAQTKEEIIETIIVGGVAEVYFTHEPQKEIQKKITGKTIPKVSVKLSNSILEVDTTGEAEKEIIKIYVSSLNLKKIIVKDAAKFYGTNSIDVKSLEIIVVDNAAANIYVDSKNIEISMKGGDLTISGKSKICTIKKLNNHEHGTLVLDNLKIGNLKTIE